MIIGKYVAENLGYEFLKACFVPFAVRIDTERIRVTYRIYATQEAYEAGRSPLNEITKNYPIQHKEAIAEKICDAMEECSNGKVPNLKEDNPTA